MAQGEDIPDSPAPKGNSRGDGEGVNISPSTDQTSRADLGLRSGRRRRQLIVDEFKTWGLKLLFGFGLATFVPFLLYVMLKSSSFFLGEGQDLINRFLNVAHLIVIAFFCAGAIPLAVWNLLDICRIVYREIKQD